MKKAKFMLAAIAVLGIAGGAFGLKAKIAFNIYTMNPANTAAGCTVTVFGATTDPLNATGPAFTTTLAWTTQGTQCVLVTLYPAN